MTEQRYGFQYHLTTVSNPDDGKALPVSHGTINGPQHLFTTVPWNAVEASPNDPGNNVSLNFGWTFLYGPVVGAQVTAHVRLQKAQAGASTHLRLWKADAQENRLWGSESPEFIVSQDETHTDGDGNAYYTSTHLDATWYVPVLAAGERLRLEVDYWNATEAQFIPARIVGARVEGTYWRSI
jgi:hypothetical protein